MKIFRFFLALCIPAILWNTPVQGGSSLRLWEEKESIWSSLSYENLSYGNIMALIDTIEYGDAEGYATWGVDEVIGFVTFLARNGIQEGDVAAKEDLERDIAWLLENETFSYRDGGEWSVAPAVYLGEAARPMPCGWLSEKWKKTRRFVKKHKKAIIVAVVVVVVATVVIAATGGAGTAPAVAGAAGAVGAANEADRPRVNKPGNVGFENDTDITQSSWSIASLPQADKPCGGGNKNSNNEAMQEQIIAIKEILSKQVPSEAFNIVPEEEPAFWERVKENAQENGAYLAHELHQAVSGSREGHEWIDSVFGTDQADDYPVATREENSQPKIVMGELPLPASGLVNVASRAATIARSTGVAIGTAAVGSALIRPTPAVPQGISKRYIDPKLPSSPDELLKDSSWLEVSHPEAQERGHRTFENQKTGEKLHYDGAKPGEPGHKGQAHWHRPNPNMTGNHDKYLDANGNPVAKGSPDSHLYSPE